MVKHTLNKSTKQSGKIVFLMAAVFSAFAVLAIIGYILYASVPAFKEIGFFDFIFGNLWAPDFEGLPASEKFGILPMIVGTLSATLGATVVGGGIGIALAIFLAYFCPKRLKGILTQVVNLLSGIPSIVYGYFGLVILVPLLSKISPSGSGEGIAAVTIILSVMIIPTVTGIAKNSLDAVPQSYTEGALALGMRKEQLVFKLLVPSAKSGLFTALGLGIGRAVGETMAVVMVAGNATIFPEGLFGNFRTLTTNIVLEMGYATGLHRNALIATGFVLLVFVLALNILLSRLKDRKPRYSRRRRIDISVLENKTIYPFHSKGRGQVFLKYVCGVAAFTVFAALSCIIIFVFYKGLPHLTWDFLFGESKSGHITLAPAFVSTAALIAISLAIAVPIGIGAAIYLTEYSKRGSKLVKLIRLFTDTLAGIPSIVFGLFGVIVFNDFFGFGYSLLSGGLTLSIMILPTIIRSVEESLSSVPDSYREASLALGAGKLRTVFVVVLPCAMRGILTAIILSIGRIVGESAALIFTAGSVNRMPNNIMSAGSSFAVMMYIFASEGLYMNQAYATAAVLIIMVAIINGLVALLGRKKKEKNEKGNKAKTRADRAI